MSPPPPVHSPWDRRATITLLVLVVLCAASTAWLVHPWYEATPLTADGSIYILCSKSLLAGKGYSVLGMPFTVRPPGFSLLIAPLLGARDLDFHALNLFVSSFGIAAVACLFALARPRLGDAVAACLALVLWTNPAFQHLANQVVSDVPGLALVLGCLVVARWAKRGAGPRAARSPSARRDLVLGLAVGLSAYVRTAAVLIVPAEILARALSPDRPTPWRRFLRERVLVFAAVPFALLLPWSIRNASHHPPWPAEQTLLASYSTGMWHEDGGDPGSPRIPILEVLGRAPDQLPAILRHLGSRLDQDATGSFQAALGAILVAALCGAAVLRRGAPEIFALLLLGTLALYFAVDWRLSLPIFAIGLAATAGAALDVLQRFVGPRPARAIVAALLLALGLVDFAPRDGWERIRSAHARDLALASALRQRLLPADTLAAPVGWHVSLLLDRPVYNLAHVARREGFAGVERVIEDHRIDAVIVRTDPPESPNLLAALEERYGRGESVGSGVLVRIRR